MRWRVFTTLAAATVIVATGGCGSGSQSMPPGNIGISSITGPDHLQIGVSSPATFLYSATVTGSSDTSVEWSVDDPSLATISAGGVATPSATKTGTVTITATAHADAAKKATLKVKVVDWILTGLGVLLINSDGTGPVVLFPLTQQLYGFCSWSYDHLAFVCANLLTTFSPQQFFIFQTDGTAAGTKLVKTLDMGATGDPVIIENPGFSPDGTKIVFEGVAADLSLGVYVVNADGASAPVLLATDPDIADDYLSAPRFSPDGSSILFASNATVWIMDADGTNQRQLVSAPSLDAMYSPDMQTVYYNGLGAFGSATGNVFRAGANGANAVEIGVAGDRLADVSPNGNSILFVNLSTPTTSGNFTANPDGSNRRPVPGAGWATW